MYMQAWNNFLAKSFHIFFILICTTCIHITKHMIKYNYNILFVVAEAIQHLCHQSSRHVQRESDDVPTSHRHTSHRTSVQGILLERNARGTL